MSLYAEYLKEREAFEIIEKEDGFATYQIGGGICYIKDIYVAPSARGKNLASQMADEIAVIAHERFCTHLYGSVCPAARGSTDSLKVLLAYGFKLKEIRDGLIIFSKEVGI